MTFLLEVGEPPKNSLLQKKSTVNFRTLSSKVEAHTLF